MFAQLLVARSLAVNGRMYLRERLRCVEERYYRVKTCVSGSASQKISIVVSSVRFATKLREAADSKNNLLGRIRLAEDK